MLFIVSDLMVLMLCNMTELLVSKMSDALQSAQLCGLLPFWSQPLIIVMHCIIFLSVHS